MPSCRPTQSKLIFQAKLLPFLEKQVAFYLDTTKGFENNKWSQELLNCEVLEGRKCYPLFQSLTLSIGTAAGGGDDDDDDNDYSHNSFSIYNVPGTLLHLLCAY